MSVTPRFEPRMLIDGQLVDGEAGTFENVDPATEQVLGSVADASPADMHRAIGAARRAFDETDWSSDHAFRQRCLGQLQDAIEADKEELREELILEAGCPRMITHGPQLDAPLTGALRYPAKLIDEYPWITDLGDEMSDLTHQLTHRQIWCEAVGVVGAIVPWNFPFEVAVNKLGQALATGNTVVLKPAPDTPFNATRLGRLIAERTDIPPGVVNVVTGFGEETGAPLAAHDEVDKVAFTGSTEVGKMIVQAAAGNLKKVSLELGGKSPNIVFADTDLSESIPGAANAIFFNHGQCCAAGSRLFAEESIYDEVVAGVAEHAKNIKVGPGLDAQTEMGPLVSDVQLDRVCGFLDSGEAEGAETVAGGKRIGDSGYFVEPTVLAGTNPQMKVEAEEIFGPVVTVKPFKSTDELLPNANESHYGLAAGVWTNDIKKAHRTAAALKAGTVWINCYNVFDAALPFGGYKESGWGREMGEDALELYTEVKAVCAQI